MTINLRCLGPIVCVLFFARAAFASPLFYPEFHGIGSRADTADAIVVGQLVDSAGVSSKDHSSSINAGRGSFPGTFDFKVIRVISGNAGSIVQVHFGYVDRFAADQGRDNSVAVGKNYLLLLEKTASGVFEPTSPLAPAIEVDSYGMMNLSQPLSPKATVEKIVAMTLVDPVLRKENIYQFSDLIDPVLIPVISKYADDPDWTVASGALTFLATNQVVSAIPKIGLFAGNSDGGFCQILTNYNNSDSILPICRLLFAQNVFTRSNAAMATGNSSGIDYTAVPYILQSLDDPDPQNSVPFYAYKAIHRTVAELGPYNDWDYYLAHKSSEDDTMYSWWNRLLSGVVCENSAEYNAAMTRFIRKQPNTNLRLFSTSDVVRRKCASEMVANGKSSDIPLLILALRDPDKRVAYASYQALHRLLPQNVTVMEYTQFAKERAQVLVTTSSWWRRHLSDGSQRESKFSNKPNPKENGVT